MATTLTLDSLREQLETRYGPVVLEGYGEGAPIRLMPIMRLSHDRRAQFSESLSVLSAKQSAASGADSDATDLNETIDAIVRLLELVCEYPENIGRIKTALKDDGQAYLLLWEQYQAATAPGEASASAA